MIVGAVENDKQSGVYINVHDVCSHTKTRLYTKALRVVSYRLNSGATTPINTLGEHKYINHG